MTLSRWRKPIETPYGAGQVSREGIVVATVNYALSVEVEELVAKTFGGQPKARLSERTVITGTVSVTDGDLGNDPDTGAASDVLTLLLEDGRALDFELAGPDSGDRVYSIRGTGDIRRVEPGDTR